MKRSIELMAFCLAVFAPVAGAYEYPLQFTPNAGYRGLVVAGYGFEGNVVVGNCSYYTVSGTSGKGGGSRGAVNKNYRQTCRWDSYGNLLSVTPGAPAVPASPLYTQGSVAVYAVNANGDTTGSDAKLSGHGFVNTPGSHYTWLTPNNSGVVQQMSYTLVATLKSDGDAPVNISAVEASALTGTAAVKSTTCVGQVKAGATCSVSLIYDASKVTSADLTYDVLRIDLTSDAGGSHDFVQKFTIITSGH